MAKQQTLHEICPPVEAITGPVSSGIELQETYSTFPDELVAPTLVHSEQLQREQAAKLGAVRKGEITEVQAVETGRAASSALGALACNLCVANGFCVLQQQLLKAETDGRSILRREQRMREKDAAIEHASAKPAYAENLELARTSPETQKLLDSSRDAVLALAGVRTSDKEPRVTDSVISIEAEYIGEKPGSAAFWKRAAAFAKAQAATVNEKHGYTKAEEMATKLDALSIAITSAVYTQDNLTTARSANKANKSRYDSASRKQKEELSYVLGLMQDVGEHYSDLGPVAMALHLDNIANVTMESNSMRLQASVYIWTMIRGAMSESAFSQMLSELQGQNLIQGFEHSTPEEDVQQHHDFRVIMDNGQVLEVDVKATNDRVGSSLGYSVAEDGIVTICPQSTDKEQRKSFILDRSVRRYRASNLFKMLEAAQDEVSRGHLILL